MVIAKSSIHNGIGEQRNEFQLSYLKVGTGGQANCERNINIQSGKEKWEKNHRMKKCNQGKN